MIGRSHKVLRTGLLALIAGCVVQSEAVYAAAAPGTSVWLEAEQATAMNVKPNVVGAGRDEFLSGDKWMNINIDPGNFAKQIRGEAVAIQYSFNTKKAGNYEVWNRIGFEFVRSPFEWRIDGGGWNRVTPDDLTTDLMELADWTEVAWLKMGAAQLSAGAHKLDIRVPKPKNQKGEPERILYASDAILIADGTFSPNGKYKPGAGRRDADDVKAAKTVFSLPEAKSGDRSSVKLSGLWEVTRHDEQMPTVVAAPIRDVPAEPHWTAISVPSNKNDARPDLLMAHRLWYRTRVNVPASQIGRSFFIDFPMNSLNTTVFVNGKYCGFNKNPLTGFQIDVTKGIKPGVNQIWVGIKDVWYGRTANPNKPLKLRKTFNIPVGYFGQGFQDLAYPIWNNSQSGILETPEFFSVGSTYATDVFVQPSVARKELNADVTVSNLSSTKATTGTIKWEAVDPKTGKTEKVFAPQPFTVAAGKFALVKLSGKWENPKLWWPNNPNMYRLRTTVTVGGKDIDVRETPFGFREWTTRGIDFVLNGVRWQQWADLTPQGANTPAEFVKIYRETNQRTFRLMMPGQQGATRYLGLPLKDVLDFFDQNGVVIRRNGLLDGEAIGYAFSEGDPDMKAMHGGSEMKMDLLNNWRDQMVQQVRTERNHPSINIWTIENEFAYINLINLLGDSPLMDQYEREITKVSDAVMKVDPTRTVVTDGGGATKFQTLPVHGNHYVFDPANSRYPDFAYEANPEGGGRGRWTWDMKRPRFIGEDYFATGINPADYAQWGGEAAFLSKTAARPAADFMYKMLTEGYRWAGQSAWHFWSGANEVVNPWNSQAWRAVFVRQYDWTFMSGQKVPRTFRIFNDTQFTNPLTFTWTLSISGKQIATQTKEYKVPPGSATQPFDEILTMPRVSARREGELLLTLSSSGKEIFRDVKKVSVLPVATFGAAPAPAATRPAASSTAPPAAGAPAAAATPAVAPTAATAPLNVVTRSSAQTTSGGGLTAEKLVVFDPKGGVSAYLKARGVPFTALNSLTNLPATGRVLVVGNDAITGSESTSSRLAAYASSGRTVIVLEQKTPLKYGALQAEMEPSTATGRVAFAEDLNHPAMRNLQQKDFMAWGSGSVVYRNAYVKPTRGAKSLVQCDVRLQDTALVEVPTGKGLMLLSQLTIGEKIGSSGVAQTLLANLVNYGLTYRLTYRNVAAVLGGNEQLAKTLDAIGMQYSRANDVLSAINDPKNQLIVVAATPANLKQLASNLTQVNDFTARGGYLVFNGLTPEGLADYNKVVGFDHMIRPMRRERVTFPVTKEPLTSGLTLGDVVMLSGERIFGWVSDEYVADDIFSYIVDYDDVAPFAKSNSFLYNNAVNGFYQADGWKLINNFPAPKSGPQEIDLSYPRPQTITEFTWVGNTLYNPQTKVGLVADGKAKQAWGVQPNAEPQTLEVKPPLTGQNISLQILAWQDLPGKNQTIGIDNFSLKAARPADFYDKVKPMLNVGGLMHYPRGKGGFVLANLNFKDNEAVPVNATKKRTIFSTVLRNLKAPFAAGGNVIVGTSLEYTPINFGAFKEKLTQYRTDRGWFGDNNFTFNLFPTGNQRFAGVPYNIFDFPTSPVPTAIMLGGNGIPNNPPQEVRDIPINVKADALFFLHTARIDQRRNNDEVRGNKRLEMARYVIHYVDGKTETLPIYSEIDIEDYKQREPKQISGAVLAWTAKYPNSDQSAVAYAKQWNNPHPDIAIKSIDMTYGADRRGVPVLLAITAASPK